MNLLHTFLGRFMVRRVDSILSEMSTGIARLEKAIHQHDQLADKHNQKALEHDAKSELFRREADRASRVATRLRDLLK